MKAYVLQGIGELNYMDVPMPEPQRGWVLVRVMAAGICGSDIPRIFETGTYHFPTVPGHEFSGEVVQLGEGVEQKWLHKRVGVFPLIPCQSCDSCRKKQYEMCQNYDYLGSRRDGGFAEYTAVPVWNLVELPPEVSFEEAAMLEPMAVGLHALEQLPAGRPESAVIYGMGPIGMMAAQWAAFLGIRKIFTVVNKKAQADMAARLGFTDVCDASKEDPVSWVLHRTSGEGVELAVEGVGNSSVFAQCIESVRPRGNILLLGNPKTGLSLEKNVYWKILRKQLNVQGTWNSSFTKERDDDWNRAVSALGEGAVKAEELITHRLPWERLQEGLELMRSKREYYCKVMITRQI